MMYMNHLKIHLKELDMCEDEHIKAVRTSITMTKSFF